MTEGETSPEAPLQRRVGERFEHHWVRELALVVGVLIIYHLGSLAISVDPAAAEANTLRVLGLEQALGLHVEPWINQWVLGMPDLAQVLNTYYVTTHLFPFAAALIWAYRCYPRRYLVVRTTFLWLMVAGLAVHALYPAAPPRLVAVDGIGTTFEGAWGGLLHAVDSPGSWVNGFAAMPSFHFTWALFAAGAVVYLAKSPWRYAALAHPTVMLFTIVGTGHHYVMDALVGGLLLALAAAVALFLHRQDLQDLGEQAKGPRRRPPV